MEALSSTKQIPLFIVLYMQHTMIKGLRMSGKVNTNVPELPFSLDKKRKYIDADKLVLEIEGQTPKK